ncbi:MAG TPA: glycosyltransferase family 4 protein [Verrucomicrobiae bacterium]|nr:glycosyltransferase family 4 protein [Verrucomicrobiae bacterium]
MLLTVPNLDSTTSPWREVVGLAKHLPREEFQLTICALRQDGVEESRPLFEQMGVECFVARFRPRGRSLSRLVEWLRDGRSIAKHSPFDLQHSMDFTSSPLEALRSRRYARKFLFSQRNMNQGGHPLLLKIKAKVARGIICVSDATYRFMSGLGISGKLARIHPGIEVEEIAWRPPAPRPDGVFRLLMVGHVVRLKRIVDAIGAIAQLAAEFPGLRLEIAGRVDDPAYKAELDQLIQDRGLGRRVSFLGPRKDVFDLMRGADALLHAAESEAFGMAILEAMAIGLPVIAPAIQGPKEIVEHNESGLLVAVGDVCSYADAVRALIRSPDLAARLAERARKRVETAFSSRRMAAEMARFYEALV